MEKKDPCEAGAVTEKELRRPESASERPEKAPEFPAFSREYAKYEKELNRDEIYQKATVTMRGIKNPEMQQRAIDLFKTIPGWRDADEKIAVCEQRIAALKEKAEAKRAAAEAESKRRRKKAAIVLSALVSCIAIAVLLFTVIIPAVRYGKAMSLYNSGRYDEAIAAFEAMEGYGSSESMIMDCRYSAADALFSAGEYDEAIAAFEALDGYRDSAERIEACRAADIERKYVSAMELFDAGNYDKAYPALTALDGYKDSAQKASGIYEEYKAARLVNAEVGEYLFFGAYEQDNDVSDGKEDIEWLVLDKEDGKMLVISRYVLDFHQYHSKDESVSWETCSLRKWLNETFLNDAFSEEEQESIQYTVVTLGKDDSDDPLPENVAVDKLFFLSQSEAYKYFDSDDERKCTPTDYAIAQGVRTSNTDFVDGRATCWWWLRLHATSRDHAACVNIDGSVYHLDLYLYLAYDGVRPAMWLSTGGN